MRALRAPLKGSAARPCPQCARTALPPLRHSGESRNPSFSCGLGIAKEREARASYAGFLLSQEWRGEDVRWDTF